jgi:3-methyladenine DNA glycosylase/8-oxoguanine DNA glycosylase
VADAAGSFAIHRPLDLAATLFPVRRGHADASLRLLGQEAWRATLTPQGPGTEHLSVDARAGLVHVEAWGPGARWLVEHAPDLVGEGDDLAGFEPARHPLVADLHRRHPGLRIPRTLAVGEALTASILEQKVPGAEARIALSRLVRRLGEPAPGPQPGLFVPPAPSRLAATGYEVFHSFGVERRRAECVRRAASYAGRLGEASEPQELQRRLQALPGVGPWTAAEVALVALGDRDAVPLGDYHLPHLVAAALDPDHPPRSDDRRMLELLEPFRPHRARVVRLLYGAGVGPPRRGPRMPLNPQLGFGAGAGSRPEGPRKLVGSKPKE